MFPLFFSTKEPGMVIKLDSVNFTKFLRILHDELVDMFEK